MLEIKILHPKIIVFKNAFNFGSEMIKHYEENFINDWSSWYSFGTKIELKTPTKQFKEFPTKDQWQENIIDLEDEFYNKQMLSVFYDVTKQYYDNVELKLDNWYFDRGDIAKYNAGAGVSETLGMNYHTDFETGKAQEPGYKFATTCVFYLNDEYDGGEICFKVFNNDFTAIDNEIKYKPSTGDVVVFPSTHPFYHGVNVTTNGSKYIVRTYWRYMYDGDPEYIKEQGLYSKKDWEDIIKERRQKVWNNIQDKIEEIKK